jgi:predicted CXXCH cytochrome family protein
VAERRTQDLCLRCHIDKGGPFRFVHMASEEGIGEGCLTCHLPHGSDNAWLHPAEGRAQCAQCHTDRYEHFIPLTCWAAGCHVGIHGSNRSALFF